jgi:hypothetical protein
MDVLYNLCKKIKQPFSRRRALPYFKQWADPKLDKAQK